MGSSPSLSEQSISASWPALVGLSELPILEILSHPWKAEAVGQFADQVHKKED